MICNKCNHKLPDDSEFCQYCGNKIGKENSISEESVLANSTTESHSINYDTVSKPRNAKIKSNSVGNNKLVLFISIAMVVLSSISILAILIAMNFQDAKRNSMENWNTTVVYAVLFVLFGVFLGFAINALINKRIKLISYLSLTLVVGVVITGIDGSIFSSFYKSRGIYNSYINRDIIELLNTIWVVCVVLICIIALIPVIVLVVKKINNSWRRSIACREKCYKRIAKMHKYLEAGIITEEEYEETRKQILKKIS